MPDFFKMYAVDFKDVYSIKNEKASKLAEEKRKNFPAGFWALLTAICAFCLYVAIDGASLRLYGIWGFAACIIFASLACVLFYRAKIFYFVSSVAIPVVIYLLRFFLLRKASEGFPDFSHAMISGALAILSCCALVLVIKLECSKTVCFAIQSSIYVFCIVASLLVAHANNGGSFTVSSISNGVNGFFDGIKQVYSDTLQTALDDKQTFDAILDLIPEELQKDAKKQDIIDEMSVALNQSIEAVKLCVPGLFALSGMMFGYIATLIFSLFARIFGLDLFISLTDDKWTYHVSKITTRLYDIILVVAVIGAFFSLPQAITAAVINMLLILTPLLACISIREIYLFFRDKGLAKALCILITAGIVFISLVTFAFWAFFMIASIGVVIISRREHLDKLKAIKMYAEEQGVEFDPDNMFPVFFRDNGASFEFYNIDDTDSENEDDTSDGQTDNQSENKGDDQSEADTDHSERD